MQILVHCRFPIICAAYYPFRGAICISLITIFFMSIDVHESRRKIHESQCKEFNNISIYAFHEYFIHLKRWSHYRGSKVAYLVGKFILMYSQKSVYWYFSFVWRCYWYVLSILLTLPNGWGHIYNGGLMCGDTGKLDRSVQQQQQQHSLLSQASWGRLEMKPKRNETQG